MDRIVYPRAYDHRKKAGNRGDLVKHPALMAELDVVITEGAQCSIRYADLFAGYARTILQPGGEWMHGIGALQRHSGNISNTHLRCWFNGYFRKGRIIGSTYPGSSLLASDTATARNCRIEMALWDNSPAACDDLTTFYCTFRTQ